MKQIRLFLILFLVTATAFAQSKTLTGSWLLTKAKLKSQTVHPYQVFEFRSDGKLLAMGYEMGQWQYDQTRNRLTLKSEKDKDFNGTSQVITLNENELTVNKDGDLYFYQRYRPDQIARDNKTAPLTGTWQLSGTDYPFAVIRFTLPDTFKLVQASDSETDRSSGTWMFVPQESAVIFIGFSHLLRGKAALTQTNDQGFTLKLAARTLTARRIDSSNQTIERLTFTEDDFPEDAEPDESQLPWQDFDAMVQALSKVTSLQYSDGQLLPDFNLLKHTHTILCKIKVQPDKPSVEFTNFSLSDTDTMQFSQNVKDHLSNSHNLFFPKEEPWPYRIKGTEKVTVPAGTFECTVVEGLDGDTKIKYWMINDLPGVYAKIIRDEVDPFGQVQYSVQELVKIDQ